MRNYYWLHPSAPLARVPENKLIAESSSRIPKSFYEPDEERADELEAEYLRKALTWIADRNDGLSYTINFDYDEDIEVFARSVSCVGRPSVFSGPYTHVVGDALCSVVNVRYVEIYDAEMRFEMYEGTHCMYICLAPDEVKPFANYVGMEVGGTVWDIWPARVNSNPGLISRMLTRLGFRNDADRPSAES